MAKLKDQEPVNITPGTEPSAADWSRLRKALAAGDRQTAFTWVRDFGLARELVELFEGVVDHAPKLEADLTNGENAAKELAGADADLIVLRRARPDSPEAARKISDALAAAESRQRAIAARQSAADVAHKRLEWLRQLCPELLGVEPRRRSVGVAFSPLDVCCNRLRIDTYAVAGWRSAGRPEVGKIRRYVLATEAQS